MKRKLTLAQHLKIARDLRKTARLIQDTYFYLQEYFPKSSRVMKRLWQLIPHVDNTAWNAAKSKLDEDYHQIITDAQFVEHGHVYYINLGSDWKKYE